MNLKLMKGYVLAILAVAILTAAAILVLNNLGGEWTMQFFWKPVTLRPAVGMLLIGAAGVVVWYTIIGLLPAAVATLRKGKQLRQVKDNQQRLKDLEKPKDETQ